MIGIFDSGIGGLTVVRALRQQIPGYDLLYFGDTARTPYGSKSAATVLAYALENIEFLLQRGATTIVMACNTASSVATEAVRDRFAVPIFEVITPAVIQALKTSRNFRFGVIGTRATVTSGVYEKKILAINPAARVYSVACPLLVPLVEEGWLAKRETRMIVKKYLQPLKSRQIETLILGCTHYPLLKPVIQQKIGQRVIIIDSSDSVAAAVKEFLRTHADVAAGLEKNNQLRIFVSDVTAAFAKMARRTLGMNVRLERVG